MHEARYWDPGQDGVVHCRLCPHGCRIRPGEAGICRVRCNRGGTLYAANYGQVSGLALDPIEKKPLYHFYPGSLILSAGSWGCNLSCGFCQNWASVTRQYPTRTLTPAQLADLALSLVDRGNCGVAFTYTEPLMWYEFVRDAAPLVRERGLKTVLVTNGFIRERPWLELLEHIDAVNIDLKAFRPDFYRRWCGGSLAPVRRAIAAAAERCHVEITTLLIEGRNTGEEEIRELAAFIAAIDPGIPLHLSRYHPAHKWTQPPTDPGLIRALADLAREQLDHVSTGNLPESWQLPTRCPRCKHVLVRRGIAVTADVEDGRCPQCRQPVNIRF